MAEYDREAFVQFTIESRRRTMHLANLGYEKILQMNTPFRYIATFTTFDKFPPENKDLALWCHAVGIWVRVLRPTGAYYLAVQNVTKDGSINWEVPSGHTEPEIDQTAFHSAQRELQQETGLVLPVHGLKPLAISRYTDNIRCGIIFFTTVLEYELLTSIHHIETLADGTEIFFPPQSVDPLEIEKLALIPEKVITGFSPPSILQQHTTHSYPTLLSAARVMFTLKHAADLL